jgi:hypothetical protein
MQDFTASHHKSHAMAQAVSRRPLTTDPCGRWLAGVAGSNAAEDMGCVLGSTDRETSSYNKDERTT